MKLVGSYVIALIYTEDPNSIYMVKNSGDLAIAHDFLNERYLVSSDPEMLRDEFGFPELYMVQDNEIVKLDKETYITNHIGKSEMKVEIKLKPGIKTFFIQEWSEQNEAVEKCLNFGGRLAGSEKGMVKLGGLDCNE